MTLPRRHLVRRRGRAINSDAPASGAPSLPVATEGPLRDSRAVSPSFPTADGTCWGDSFQEEAPESVLRVVALNVSGLPAHPGGIKYQDLLHFIHDYSVDIICLSELNLAWHCLPEPSHFAQVTRPWFRSVSSTVAWYRDQSLTTSFQRGGVGILVRDSHTGRICGSGEDPVGLGRWAWIRLRGHHGSHLRVFSAYRPVFNPRDPGSVWNQHNDFFQAQTPPRLCEPRQAFLVDLTCALQAAYDAGDQVLLSLDANEPHLWQPNNQVSQTFASANLHDLHLERHDRTTAPPTHNRGLRPIDAMFGSASLQPYTSGYLPFGSGPGDHRPLWIDLSLPHVFGQPTRATTPSAARRLQCRDPRTVARYHTALHRHYAEHRISERSFQLETSVSGPLTSSQAAEWECLDKLRTEGIFHANFRCRRLRTDAVPWTPALGQTLQVHRFWDKFYHFRIGRHVSFSFLRRLARKAGLEIPAAKPVDDILAQRQLAWERYRAAKKAAPQERQGFLSQLAQARADAGLEAAATGLSNMLRRERQRRDAAILRSILQPGQRRGLSSVDIPTPNTGTWTDGDWTGLWTTRTDRQGMEQGCLEENDRRFRQASDTDLLTPSLLAALGPMGTSPLAVELVAAGATKGLQDYGLSDAALLYLSSHRRPAVLHLPSSPLPLDFRTQAYSRSWLKMDEFTASGPSGLHFGHFQANAMDPQLAAVDAALARIPTLSGYVPLRWMQGMNVMLEKKPGVSQVTKLRTILLYEADYNHNNKLLGRAMMRFAETNALLAPEQYGSRKAHSAIFQSVNKVLTFDILRQSRHPGALCSNDAKSCYDRIVHSTAGLAMQRCGVPPALVKASLGPIQRLKHYIRTQYGDSTTFFSADSGEVPVQGIGQGNGAGPAIWAVVSTPIFNAMRQRGYGIFLRSPGSGTEFLFVGYAFVDDTDVVVNDVSVHATAASVTEKLQTSINFWEEALRASGGALAPAKCHWYLIDYQWTGKSWRLVTPADTPATITVRSPSGRRIPIDRVDPHEGRKTLGVWSSPDGSMAAQLKYLREKVAAWVEKIRVRHLPHHLVWLSLRTGIYKTLEYPLAATTFSELECRELVAPLLKVGLSRSHIVRSMPRDIVHGTSNVGGLALPQLYVEQGIAHLRTYLQFGRSRQYITGFLLRASMEYLQIELGCLGHPFQCSYDTWSHCAVPTWCTSLWQFCSHSSIQAPAIIDDLPLLRIGDRPLIFSFWLAGYRTPKILAKLNQCRLALRALTLADIVSTDGRHILTQAWQGTAPCGRCRWSDSWPRSPPFEALDWDLWRTALQSALGVSERYQTITTTLGSWLIPSGQCPFTFFCPEFDRLYLPASENQWRMFTRCPTRRGRPRFQASNVLASWSTLALTPSLFPADVYGSSDVVTLLTHDPAPFPIITDLHLPSSPPRFSWSLPCLGPITQVWFDRPSDFTLVQFLHALSSDSLASFSDGSAHHQVSGTCAWGFAFAPDTLIDLSAGFRIPGPPVAQSSFRSELGGLYAILMVVRHVVRHFPSATGTISFATDSQAVLDRCFNYPRPVDVSFASWDLVSLCRELLDSMPLIRWHSFHVSGHQDSSNPSALDIWARRNIAMDERATAVYDQVACPADVPIHQAPIPPFWLNDTPVFSDFAPQLRAFLLDPPLVSHWQKLHRFGATLDPAKDVAWESYSPALRSIPQSRRHWIIKATAQRSAVGIEMVRRRSWRSPTCPVCLQEPETATHVFRCADPRVLDCWQSALQKLEIWFSRTFTNPVAARVILTRFQEWTHRRPYSVFTTTVPHLAAAVDAQDRMGWDATLYGFWAKEWIEMQDVYLRFLGRRNTGRRWLTLLIQQVWNTSWDLWEHRNGIYVAAELSRARQQRQDAIRHWYANPPALPTPAVRMLLRRPLPTRLQDSVSAQEAFLRRMTTHTHRRPDASLRLQQHRFRKFFRPPPSPG